MYRLLFGQPYPGGKNPVTGRETENVTRLRDGSFANASDTRRKKRHLPRQHFPDIAYYP